LLAPESVRNAYIEYLQREEQGEIMEDEDLRESVIKYLKMTTNNLQAGYQYLVDNNLIDNFQNYLITNSQLISLSPRNKG
jgi:hypothetical protein